MINKFFFFFSSTQHSELTTEITSCARGDTICPRPLQVLYYCLYYVSCKYENRQRLQFTTEFAKRQTTTTTTTRKNKHCAILPSLYRHCQSKAKQSRAEYGRICPSNKLTFDLLTLTSGVSRLAWLRSPALLVFCCISLVVLSYMSLFSVIMEYRTSGIT